MGVGSDEFHVGSLWLLDVRKRTAGTSTTTSQFRLFNPRGMDKPANSKNVAPQRRSDGGNSLLESFAGIVAIA